MMTPEHIEKLRVRAKVITAYGIVLMILGILELVLKKYYQSFYFKYNIKMDIGVLGIVLMLFILPYVFTTFRLKKKWMMEDETNNSKK